MFSGQFFFHPLVRDVSQLQRIGFTQFCFHITDDTHVHLFIYFEAMMILALFSSGHLFLFSFYKYRDVFHICQLVIQLQAGGRSQLFLVALFGCTNIDVAEQVFFSSFSISVASEAPASP